MGPSTAIAADGPRVFGPDGSGLNTDYSMGIQGRVSGHVQRSASTNDGNVTTDDPNAVGALSGVKVAVIGAGSAQFSLGLIKDLCLEPGLSGSRVVFMDTDPHRLDMIHRLGVRYANELAVDVTFEQTTDRMVALEDAGFVLNTASFGHSEEEADRALAEAHGYYRGTRLNALRNLELMLSVARSIEQVCPDAWLLQSSNPVFDGCTLMTRHTSVKAIGLCHGHFGYRRIARVLGVDPQEVRCEAVGVNHCIWATHLTYRGDDLYPRIDRWVETEAEAYWASHSPTYDDVQMSRAAIDQYQFLGLMGIGDTVRHTGWQYHLDLETKQRWFGGLGGFDSELGWAGYLRDLSDALTAIGAAALDESVPVTEIFPPTRTSEQQIPIINSIVNDEPATYQVNVPNRGVIPGIDDDVVVEVPAMINAWGIRPLRVEELPRRIMLHVVLPKVLEMERHLDALMHGDRNMLMSSLLWDHRTKTVDQAAGFLDALLDQPHNHGLRDHLA